MIVLKETVLRAAKLLIDEFDAEIVEWNMPLECVYCDGEFIGWNHKGDPACRKHLKSSFLKPTDTKKQSVPVQEHPIQGELL